MSAAPITVSIVSHRQNALANALLGDLAQRCRDIAVVITENVPDPEPLQAERLPFPVRVLRNDRVKGFGANHNAAFRECRSDVFCVLNPDLRLAADPFPVLLEALSDPKVAAVGPLVLDPQGRPEDSARRFPTVGSLARKALAGKPGPEYPVDQGAQRVDWVGGMCMALRSEAFARVSGFDERFFLYYEDVDLCRRLGAAGYAVLYEPRASVVHHARRTSRRKARYMAIHAASLLRYLMRS